jgi:hypothetical protein
VNSALSRVTKGERNIVHMLIKSRSEGKATLMDLRKFHYNILCRSDMGEVGAEVLAGRAKSISQNITLFMNSIK